MSDRFRDLAGRLGRQSGAYALVSIVGPGTGLLLLPVYTRYLDPAQFGLIALLEVIALVLATVFSLGMTALVPFLYVDHADVDSRRRAFGTLIIGVTAVNVVLAALAWVAGPAMLSVMLPSVPFKPYVPIVIMTILLDPYWVMAGAALQIQERAGTLAAWSTARILISAAIRLWFVVALLGGAQGFIIANLITAAVFAIAAGIVIRSEVTLAFRPAVIREALHVGGPAVPNNLLSYGFRLLDRVVLERVATLDQVGVYYLALRVADVMRLCSDMLINAWRPIFFKEGTLDAFAQTDAPRLIRLVTSILVTVFVVLSVFAREVVSLLATPQYAAASHLVPILVGAMAIKALQSFPSLVIWLRKQTKWVPILTASTLGVSLAANWLLAPRWGVTGIAAALVISHAFLAAAMFALARRLYTLVYPWREMTIAAGLGVCTVAIALAGPEKASAASVAGKLILLGCYGMALLATRCLPIDDLRVLLVRRPLVSLESKA